jgi:phosphomevalonate kinase
MIVRAPGKAFVSGEYAMLHGAPGVVVAVDRHARARLETGGSPELSPFLAELVRRRPAPAGQHPVVDSSALHDARGVKLGLGGSAAVTVAAAGALLAAEGRPLDHQAERAELLRLCVAAHRAAQGGRGSGGDVAASVYGGVVRVALHDGAVEVTPAALPDGFTLKLFRLGGPASTPEMLRQVEALAAAESARHAALMEALVRAAEDFGRDPIASLRAQLRRLTALGVGAGVEIVPRAGWALAAAAEAVGGAAKPSGAGGGDLAVALVPTARVADFVRMAAATPLEVEVDEVGVTVEH